MPEIDSAALREAGLAEGDTVFVHACVDRAEPATLFHALR